VQSKDESAKHLGYKNDPSTRTSQEAYEIGLTLIDGAIDKQKIQQMY